MKGSKMDARFILTKETREQLEKPLGLHRIGELRWQKLEELENSGRLQFAKRRIEVAKMVGINDYKAGHSWVTGLIHKKALIEIPTGFGEYEYHLGKKLNYKSGRNKKVDKPVKVVNVAPQEVKVENNMVVTITQKDMTIKIENIEIKGLIELVNNMKGEK